MENFFFKDLGKKFIFYIFKIYFFIQNYRLKQLRYKFKLVKPSFVTSMEMQFLRLVSKKCQCLATQISRFKCFIAVVVK